MIEENFIFDLYVHWAPKAPKETINFYTRKNFTIFQKNFKFFVNFFFFSILKTGNATIKIWNKNNGNVWMYYLMYVFFWCSLYNYQLKFCLFFIQFNTLLCNLVMVFILFLFFFSYFDFITHPVTLRGQQVWVYLSFLNGCAT